MRGRAAKPPAHGSAGPVLTVHHPGALCSGVHPDGRGRRDAVLRHLAAAQLRRRHAPVQALLARAAGAGAAGRAGGGRRARRRARLGRCVPGVWRTGALCALPARPGDTLWPLCELVGDIYSAPWSGIPLIVSCCVRLREHATSLALMPSCQSASHPIQLVQTTPTIKLGVVSRYAQSPRLHLLISTCFAAELLCKYPVLVCLAARLELPASLQPRLQTCLGHEHARGGRKYACACA